MNGLFPIIRRKRRPLIVEDAPPAEKVETLKPETLKIEPVEVGGSPQGLEPAASSPVGAPKRKK